MIDIVQKALGFLWKLVPKRTEYVSKGGDGGTIIIIAGEVDNQGEVSARGGRAGSAQEDKPRN
ncbi:MAG: hypothetical protein OXS47_05295 [Chloroflexota bacterium]|nr:hypothetical protein [Chloroflexota bacterium]